MSEAPASPTVGGFSIADDGTLLPQGDSGGGGVLTVTFDSALRPIPSLPQSAATPKAVALQLAVARSLLSRFATLLAIRKSAPERQGLRHTLHLTEPECSLLHPESSTARWTYAYSREANRVLTYTAPDGYFDPGSCFTAPETDLNQPAALYAAHQYVAGDMFWVLRASGFSKALTVVRWCNEQGREELFRKVARNDRAAAFAELEPLYESRPHFFEEMTRVRKNAANPAAAAAFVAAADLIKPRLLKDIVGSVGERPLVSGWQQLSDWQMIHRVKRAHVGAKWVNAAATVAVWRCEHGDLDDIPTSWLDDVARQMSGRKVGGWLRWSHRGWGRGGLMVAANPGLVAEHGAAFGIPGGALLERYEAGSWVEVSVTPDGL